MKVRFLILLFCLAACRSVSTPEEHSSIREAADTQEIANLSLCSQSKIQQPTKREEGPSAKVGVIKLNESSPKITTQPVLTEDQRLQQDQQIAVYANPEQNIRCPEDLIEAEKAQGIGLTSGTNPPPSTTTPIRPNRVNQASSIPKAESLSVLIPQDPKQPNLPNTRPVFIVDPVEPDVGESPGFGCYGGCGASCACAGLTESNVSNIEIVNGQKMECSYQVIECYTHAFCRWHDACYYACDFSYPNNGALRASCYRSCDSGCLTGRSPSPLMPEWPDKDLDIFVPDAPFSPLNCIRFATNNKTDLYKERMRFSKRLSCIPKT